MRFKLRMRCKAATNQDYSVNCAASARQLVEIAQFKTRQAAVRQQARTLGGQCRPQLHTLLLFWHPVCLRGAAIEWWICSHSRFTRKVMMKMTLTAEQAPRLTPRAAGAEDLMTPNPISIRAWEQIRESVASLAGKGFSAAPVIDEAGRPIGVLSRSCFPIHDRKSGKVTVPDEWSGKEYACPDCGRLTLLADNSTMAAPAERSPSAQEIEEPTAVTWPGDTVAAALPSKAVEIARRGLGEGHRDTLLLMRHLADVYQDPGPARQSGAATGQDIGNLSASIRRGSPGDAPVHAQLGRFSLLSKTLRQGRAVSLEGGAR